MLVFYVTFYNNNNNNDNNDNATTGIDSLWVDLWRQNRNGVSGIDKHFAVLAEHFALIIELQQNKNSGNDPHPHSHHAHRRNNVQKFPRTTSFGVKSEVSRSRANDI